MGILDRFWLKVRANQSAERCWEWSASKTPKGYGHFTMFGKVWQAHRAAYELFIGPIPEGLQILHKCDNPGCVRPDHLFLGNNDDNVADRVKKGRSNRPTGIKNGRAKITPEIVVEIRNSSASGASLARVHGLGETSVYRIRRGEAWAHV